MIFGKQVRLRGLEHHDLPLFVNWLNDPEIRQNLTLFVPLSMGQEEKWYENLSSTPVEEHPLVIEVDTADGWTPVGNTAFINIDWHSRCAEIGIFIGEKLFWNHGYGRESIKLMLHHGFDNLNLNRIYLRVFETNQRAIRCYEHAGFYHEGRMRQAHYLDGQYIDVLFMSVLHTEWEGKV